MRNNVDKEDDYDYWPNDLAELSINNPVKYRQIVESNLSEKDTIEAWERRNMEWAQRDLQNQRNNNL